MGSERDQKNINFDNYADNYKDYIAKRTIYQKYLELFVWKGNKNANTR